MLPTCSVSINEVCIIFCVIEGEPNITRMQEPVIIVGDIHG